MSLEVTLALFVVSAGLLGYSIWRVRQKYDVANPPLLDWHYVLFPTILSTGLLLLHVFMLLRGK